MILIPSGIHDLDTYIKLYYTAISYANHAFNYFYKCFS